MNKLDKSQLNKKARLFFKEEANKDRKQIFMTDDGSIFYEDGKYYADSHAQGIGSQVHILINEKYTPPVKEDKSGKKEIVEEIITLIPTKDIEYGHKMTAEKLDALDLDELTDMRNNLLKVPDRKEDDKKDKKEQEKADKLAAELKEKEEKEAKEKEDADAKAEEEKVKKEADDKAAADKKKEDKPEGKKEDVNEPKMQDHVVTEDDLKNNPELVEKGVKVGDTIEIPGPLANTEL